MATLPAVQRDAIIELFRAVGLKKTDDLKLTYSGGVIKAVIRREATGDVQTAHFHAKGGFRQVSQFRPEELTLDERRELTVRLSAERHTQAEIAELLGVSQATVSLDLRRARG